MQNLSKGICRVEDALEMVEKFCYLDGMFSLYGGASDADNAGKGSALQGLGCQARFVFEVTW